MATVQGAQTFREEIADFLASRPTQEQLVNYHFSEAVQQRVRELLTKLKDGFLTEEEQRELDDFEDAELFIQLVKAKARLRSAQGPQP